MSHPFVTEHVTAFRNDICHNIIRLTFCNSHLQHYTLHLGCIYIGAILCFCTLWIQYEMCIVQFSVRIRQCAVCSLLFAVCVVCTQQSAMCALCEPLLAICLPSRDTFHTLPSPLSQCKTFVLHINGLNPTVLFFRVSRMHDDCISVVYL